MKRCLRSPDLPGKSHEQKNLVDSVHGGRKESDTAEVPHQALQFPIVTSLSELSLTGKEKKIGETPSPLPSLTPPRPLCFWEVKGSSSLITRFQGFLPELPK